MNSSSLGNNSSGEGRNPSEYSTAEHSTAEYSTVEYSAVEYSAVEYSAVEYSAVEYSAVEYSAVEANRQQGPASLELTGSLADTLFPFFFSFDASLRIVEIGRSLKKLLPALAPGADLTQHFSIERPEASLTFQAIASATNAIFLLRQSGQRFLLRGQMVLHPSKAKLTYLCSPYLVSSRSMQLLDLCFGDFALHDPIPEFVQILNSNRLELDDLGRLSAKLQEERQALRQANTQLEHALEQERTSHKQAQTYLQAQSNGIASTRNRILAYLPNAGFSQAFLRDLNEDLSNLIGQNTAITSMNTHFRVGEVLRELAHFLRRVAEAKGVSISISCKGLDDVLLGDSNLVYRLLKHLAHNAIKFGGGGEVAITAQAASKSRPEDLHLVVFKVMDTGHGMSSTLLADINRAFKSPRLSSPILITGPQGNPAHATPSGLGLAFAKQLVDLMHGSIEAVSTLGQGSLFTVKLPLPLASSFGDASQMALNSAAGPQNVTAAVALSPEMPLSEVKAMPSSPTSTATLKRRSVSLDIHVLLLEPSVPSENGTNGRMPIIPKQSLEDDGFRIDAAKSIEDLLAMLEYAQYDVVLLNCSLKLPTPPDEPFSEQKAFSQNEALAAARRIRLHDPGSELRLPILAITATADETTLRLCAEAGIDECIPHPTSLQRLEEVLSRCSRYESFQRTTSERA